jgi:hypothetical protein
VLSCFVLYLGCVDLLLYTNKSSNPNRNPAWITGYDLFKRIPAIGQLSVLATILPGAV